MQRDININRISVLVLCLAKFDPADTHVLGAKTDGILATSAGVKQ